MWLRDSSVGVPRLAENKNPLLQSVHICSYLKCVYIFLGHPVFIISLDYQLWMLIDLMKEKKSHT